MATIDSVITNLEAIGIFEFFLPFIFIFAVVFGMLQKTQIFGKGTDKSVTKINAVISFTFAMFIMVYPTTNAAVFSLADILANMVGGTLIYVFGIIVFMIIMFMIANPLKGDDKKLEVKNPLLIGAVVAAFLIIALFLFSPSLLQQVGLGNTGVGFGGGFTGFNIGFIDPTMITMIALLIVVMLAIWWVTKS